MNALLLYERFCKPECRFHYSTLNCGATPDVRVNVYWYMANNGIPIIAPLLPKNH